MQCAKRRGQEGGCCLSVPKTGGGIGEIVGEHCYASQPPTVTQVRSEVGKNTGDRRSASQPSASATCAEWGKTRFLVRVRSREGKVMVRMPGNMAENVVCHALRFCIAPAWLAKNGRFGRCRLACLSDALRFVLCKTDASCEQPNTSISYRGSLFKGDGGYKNTYVDLSDEHKQSPEGPHT
jgi:hypothetical protein